MRIIVNGKDAVLKKGTSFDFIAENRSFTGADGYSLAISFPLRDCPENCAIFGQLHRIDADIDKVVFDCEINDVNLIKHGVLAIVDANEVEIKAQFLEGRSEQNFDVTFDEIYINELDLGSYPISSLPADPSSQWLGIDNGQEAVALPWVNNSSGNIQNEVVYANNAYSYHEDCKGLSFQPYLIPIVERICEALGYTYDLSQWRNHNSLKYLIVCNTLPWAWDLPQFARVLPRWSVTEFFEKLELFLLGEFEINHKEKKITFSFSSDIVDSTTPVRLDKVVNGFSSDVSSDDESNFIGLANLRYKDCGHHMNKFYNCPWFVEDYPFGILSYDTLDELISANLKYQVLKTWGKNTPTHKILYAKDVDSFFVLKIISSIPTDTIDGFTTYRVVTALRAVNVFGGKKVEDVTELEFVPVCIDGAGYSSAFFLDIPEYEESQPNESIFSIFLSPDGETMSCQILDEGEKSEQTAYFDEIFVAFWDGKFTRGQYPCPVIDSFSVFDDWSVQKNNYTLRRDSSIFKNSPFKINPKQKFQFSFISDTIPNVRSVFFVDGKKYLCEKITASFSEKGMSQLLKGSFYRIID